jgi:hypothetical protein
VVAAVWVLAAALVVVPEGVAARVTAVVGSDVAAAVSGSGCEQRGWGLGWGAVGRFGSERRHSRGAGGRFGGGNEVVVVVVDDVDVVDVADGGCAGVVGDDMAESRGDDGLVAVSSLGTVCITASAVVVEVV